MIPCDLNKCVSRCTDLKESNWLRFLGLFLQSDKHVIHLYWCVIKIKPQGKGHLVLICSSSMERSRTVVIICFFSFLLNSGIRIEAQSPHRILSIPETQPYRSSYHFQPTHNWMNGINIIITFTNLFLLPIPSCFLLLTVLSVLSKFIDLFS